jgi:hypothetical protein
VLGASTDHGGGQFCLSGNPKALYNGVGVVKRHFEVRDVFVSCQAAVHRLPQQVRKRQLRVLPPRVGQVLFDEFAESPAYASYCTSLVWDGLTTRS